MVNLKEIFEKPLLIEVVFEARFRSYLKIFEKLPDFQEMVIDDLPEFRETFKSQFPLSPSVETSTQTTRYWEFNNSAKDTGCQISINRLSLHSKKYKSWDDAKGEKGFNSILQSVLNAFQKIFSFKLFERVGLRYINKIEIEEKTTEWLNKFFIPLFDSKKYPLEDIFEYLTILRIKKQNGINITIQNPIQFENEHQFYYLDFDAYSQNIKDNEIFSIIPLLHNVILSEFHSLVTENCREKMRGR